MAKMHGQHGVVRVGALGLAHIQSWNIDLQAAALEGYSMGESWTDAEVGVKKWSGSLECYYDPADAAQIALDVGSIVTLSLYPGGNSSGAHYREGQAIVTGNPLSANKDGWVTVTFNFMGKGPLSLSTVV